MDNLPRFYPESRMGGFSKVDGTVAFYTRINALLTPASVAIDFGCGRGAWLEDAVVYRRNLRMLKGKAQTVIGLDVDPVGATNPAIDEFRLLKAGEPLPLAGHSADVLVADCVMEHLAHPEFLFEEARRVLRPGGALCIRTSNVLSYIGAVATLIPERFHHGVLGKAQRKRKTIDIFPAVYRCNTVFTLRRAFRKGGFEAVVYGHESEPQYLDFSSLIYSLGVLYQQWSPSSLRSSLFGFGVAQ